MSSQQDLIKLNEVIAQCNQLLKEQSDGWKSIVEEIKKVNSNAPSSYIKMQKEIADNLQRLEALEQKYTKTKESASKIQTKINTDVQKTLNTGSALAKQRDKEIAQTEKLNNVYNKVQQKVNALTQTYNNIAVKKELGLKLTAREEAQLNSLTSRLEKYNGVLKKVDADIGKNQRNVGNYASSWNGLGNSINQLTREAPAFAVSMSTGFLALSNNIPILADEIGNLINKNKELQAQGKPTKSVLGSILGAVLSWQTALSVGVTLLTLYGAEIVDWVSKLVTGDKAVSALKKTTEAYNEALKSGEYKKAYEDITKVGIAFEQAKKGTISKKEALLIYNETLGDTFGRTNDLNEAESIYNKNADNYVSAMLARASANHLLAESARLSAEAVELENKKEFTWLEKRKAELQNLFKNTSKYSATALAQMESVKEASSIRKQIEENKTAIKGFFSEFEKLSKGLNLGNAFGNDPSNKSNKDNKTQEQKDLSWDIKEQEINNQIAITKNFEEQMLLRYQLASEWYKEQLKLAKGNAQQIELATQQYTGKLIELNNQEYEHVIKKDEDKAKFLKSIQDSLLKSREQYYDKVTNANRKATEEEIKNIERIKEALKGFLDETANGSLSSLGFGSLSALFDDKLTEMWKNTESATERMAIAFQVFGQIAGDVFNVLEQQQRANFEAQMSRIDKEKEHALKFAGESATGREEIERQADEKKKKLQTEQAKRDKKMAILQVAINTAVGITSALALLPPNIPLSITIGAIGALQAGIIASQPLPEFWTGTDNAPEGFALTQERGAEIITDKNGNIKTLGSNKGAQLTYLNKGDKVLTATETQQKLNEMLMSGSSGNNINIETSNGLTAEEMESIMNKTLAKQPKNSLNIDERGFNVYQEKQNQRKILRNKNVRI